MNTNGLTFALSILIFSTFCNAGEPAGPSTRPVKLPDADEVIEYRGSIGEKLPIGLSLRFPKNGLNPTGTYFYYKHCADIRIEAKIDGRAICIQEFDKAGKQTGQFVGEFPTVDPKHHFTTKDDLQTEVIAGKWSKPDGTGEMPFYLIEEFSYTWREGKCSYDNAGFDDAAIVDEFMARFRKAVLADEKKKVAAMISYPIEVVIDKQRQTIGDADELVANYEKIFVTKYIESIRKCPTCHLFSRYDGVMLGSGEVWVAPMTKDGKTVPIVSAINNDWFERPEPPASK